MTFFLPLFYIIGISGTASLLTGRRFERVLPLSLMGGTLIVFLSGLITGSLTAGYWTAFATALLFPVLAAVACVKKRGVYAALSHLLTPAFAIFVMVYTLLFVLNFRRGFHVWDEISHWGPMVKETLRLDRFYSDPASMSMIHRDYPPILCLFECVWCKLCGGYREAVLYRALQTLCLSMLFPALSKLDWRRGWRFAARMLLTVLGLLVSCAVIQVGEASFFGSVYIDCALGMLAAYCMYLVFFGEATGWLDTAALVIAASFLLLSKQMAVYFLLLMVLALLLRAALQRRDAPANALPRAERIRRMVAPVLAAAVPLALLALWNGQVDLGAGYQQFSFSGAELFELPGILTKRAGAAYQQTAAENYIKALLDTNVLTQPLPLTYGQAGVAFVLLFFGLARYGRAAGMARSIHCVNALVFPGAIGYAFVMLMMYVFAFGTYESARLVSFYRYLNTYWFFAFMLAVMIFLRADGERACSEAEKRPPVALFAAVCGMMLCIPAGQGTAFAPVLADNSITAGWAEDAELIRTYTEEEDRVLIVDQRDDGLQGLVFQYLLLPQATATFSLGAPYGENDIWTQNWSIGELTEELRAYDYLFLYIVDEQFLDAYGAFFAPDENLLDKPLFAVTAQPDGGVTLTRVN